MDSPRHNHFIEPSDKFLKKRNLNAAIIGVNFDEEIYDLM